MNPRPVTVGQAAATGNRRAGRGVVSWSVTCGV